MKHAELLEIEIKLPIPDLESLRVRLQQAGFVLKHPQASESSVLWDQEETLRKQGSALRLRRYGSQAILTWKGPRQEDARLKIRPEIETAVEDPEAMEGILRALGFAPAFSMVKSRSQWVRADLEACLDEAPFGCFIELEGSREAIQQALEDLALTEIPPEPRSYPELFKTI